MNLPDIVPTRKQRFEAALKLAGLTMEQWRTDVYPVSWTHLDAVFANERVGSAALNGAIDALIDKYLQPVQ
jgi:hypothetical protein